MSHSNSKGEEKRKRGRGRERGRGHNLLKNPFWRKKQNDVAPSHTWGLSAGAEFTPSSNDHHINAKTSLSFSSCFLDFKIISSYGLERDSFSTSTAERQLKKASPPSLSVPWELPSSANWVCTQQTGAALAEWPRWKWSLERPQYIGNTLTPSRAALGEVTHISTSPAQRGPNNLPQAGETPCDVGGQELLSPVPNSSPLSVHGPLGALGSLLQSQNSQWLLSPSTNFLTSQLFWDYGLSGPRAILGPLCWSHPATAACTDSSCCSKAQKGRQE